MDSCAVRGPGLPGVKLTVMVQLEPESSHVVPERQVPPVAKSPGFAPVTVMLSIRMGEETDLIVTVCGTEVEPAVTVPNSSACGARNIGKLGISSSQHMPVYPGAQ
jgi:hypothetical protein